MSRSQILLTVTALAAFPALAPPLAAQDDDEPAIEPRIEIYSAPAKEMFRRYVISRRARLGVIVNLRARASDSLGAYLDAVTPGSSAEKAGLRAGDIITKLNGKELAVKGSPVRMYDDESQKSPPGLRLIEMVARIQPNDTVRLEYRRGNDRRSATVVAEAQAGGNSFAYSMGPFRQPLPPGKIPEPMGLMGPGFEMMWWGTPLAEIELAPLNADLGEYFGTTEGVLVISVPKDSPLGLKGGDVIQAVDGRKTSSASHLHRVLRSYEPGERFKLNILRNRRREEVTGNMPESEWRQMAPPRRGRGSAIGSGSSGPS